MRRGGIYWVNLGPSQPPEFGKIRPGLLVSSSVHNETLNSVVVIPLSTSPGEIWPLRLQVPGLPGQASFAVLPGLRQVAKQRLVESITFAPSDWMRRLDEALMLYLGE
jgi:mRNA-degrading endonuclease toxin of MazEF toxin-antitoxin module